MKALKVWRACAECDRAISSAKDSRFFAGRRVCRECLNALNAAALMPEPAPSDFEGTGAAS